MNRHRVLNIIKKVQFPGFSQEHNIVFGEGKEQWWFWSWGGVVEGRSRGRRGEKYGEKNLELLQCRLIW